MIGVSKGKDQEASSRMALASWNWPGLIRTSTGSGTIIASMCMQ